ncbi:hypothetical protein N7457_006963 [Penicillium paradoxum]|uniref:uncharacterized protein n=1 Tax=Penicillium paradoxum TaxID=176176 RepID=UPI002549B03E|nr:uncharacterized protein N7457_006963 [Penicillium paradoxum]KAJ5779243.1 hypothetical protein N7457_006963 [Penicillium paradoxum]
MAYTDSGWHFSNISHDSKWSEWVVLGRRGALEWPFSLLVWMLQRAAAISPFLFEIALIVSSSLLVA